MSKFALTISDKYVPTWGIREIIREIVTNSLDGETSGFPKEIDYLPKTRTLRVSNKGKKLDKAVLLLGHTTKAEDDNQIGQFGEGLKLALLAAARSGLDLKVINGDETWSPSMEESDVFPGNKVLTISTRNVNSTGRLTFLIGGVTEEDWKETQKRFLCLSPPFFAVAALRDSTIIFDEERAGKLFVKGVYVTEKKDLVYGYDLAGIKMNRDRSLVEDHDLKSITASAWGALVESDLILGKTDSLKSCLIPMLEAESEDIQWIRYRLGGNTRDGLIKDFEEKYGDKAVPVVTGDESIAAGHVGLRGVVISRLYADILYDNMGTLKEQIKQHCDSIVEIYEHKDLTDQEIFNYERVLSYMEMAAKICGHKPLASRTQIVRFNGTCQGMWSAKASLDRYGTISLARNILLDIPTLVATFAHEIGHDIAGDGDVRHERAECDLLGTYASLLMKETLFLGYHEPILAAHDTRHVELLCSEAPLP